MSVQTVVTNVPLALARLPTTAQGSQVLVVGVRTGQSTEGALTLHEPFTHPKSLFLKLASVIHRRYPVEMVVQAHD